MRVLMLVQSAKDAAARYRALQFRPSLERAGSTVDVEVVPDGWWERFRSLWRTRNWDVVFLQRRLMQPWHTAWLGLRAKRLVFDFDDALFFRPPERGGGRSLEKWLRFRCVMRAADMVLAGNGFLRDLTGLGQERVVTLPTCVDPAKYDEAAAARRRDDGVVKLGWIGSRSTLPYLTDIRDALDEAAALRPGLRLKVVCDAFPEMRRMEVEKAPWSEATEAQDVADMDIGLAPMREDPWSLGKCGLKMLQYMAASRPVICSPVGAQAEMAPEGVCGRWARTREEWVKAIVDLAGAPERRAALGRGARQVMGERYSLDAVAPRFVTAVLG